LIGPKYSLLLLLPALFYGCAAGNKTPGETSLQEALPHEIKFLDTDYLEATPGYRGEVLDAEIIDSEIRGESQKIEINIPIDPGQVDQIRVISSSGKKIKQEKAAEVMRDYENNNVGITIFLSKQKNLGFKLRLIDQPDGN